MAILVWEVVEVVIEVVGRYFKEETTIILTLFNHQRWVIRSIRISLGVIVRNFKKLFWRGMNLRNLLSVLNRVRSKRIVLRSRLKLWRAIVSIVLFIDKREKLIHLLKIIMEDIRILLIMDFKIALSSLILLHSPLESSWSHQETRLLDQN